MQIVAHKIARAIYLSYTWLKGKSMAATPWATLEPLSILDISALCISATMILAYYIVLGVVVNQPNCTNRVILNLQSTYRWMKMHIRITDAVTVTTGIQTLRNTILVAIFIGGYAFLFAFNTISAIPDAPSQAAKIGLTITVSCLFLSFLCWASVIRIASHLGYKIGIHDNTSVVSVEKLLAGTSNSSRGGAPDCSLNSSNGSSESEPESNSRKNAVECDDDCDTICMDQRRFKEIRKEQKMRNTLKQQWPCRHSTYYVPQPPRGVALTAAVADEKVMCSFSFTAAEAKTKGGVATGKQPYKGNGHRSRDAHHNGAQMSLPDTVTVTRSPSTSTTTTTRNEPIYKKLSNTETITTTIIPSIKRPSSSNGAKNGHSLCCPVATSRPLLFAIQEEKESIESSDSVPEMELATEGIGQKNSCNDDKGADGSSRGLTMPQSKLETRKRRECESDETVSHNFSGGLEASRRRGRNTNGEQMRDRGVVAIDHKFRQSDFNRERYKMMFYLLMYFSLGFRFLFISIPFIFFTFLGPVALLTVSTVLVTYMYVYDYQT